MSKPTGGPAFPHAFQELDRQGMPCTQAYFQEGMTLRDYFAAKAMQGMLADPDFDYPAEEVAFKAFTQADAMIAERAK